MGLGQGIRPQGAEAKSKQKTRMPPLLTSRGAQRRHPGSEKLGDLPRGMEQMNDRAASSKPSFHYVQPLVFNLQIPKLYTKS